MVDVLERLPIPDELKLENQSSLLQYAIFDKLDFIIDFRPGKDNIGAIVKNFIDAIRKHDQIVVEYENALKIVAEKKKVYRKRNRLFRNLDSAWNVIMTNPSEFQEYLDLLPKMKNIEKRLSLIEDPIVKAKLQDAYQRFLILQPICSKQQIIYDTYSNARQARDVAVKELLEAEELLRQCKEEEKIAASFITDDHILADETKRSLTTLFANIQIGYQLITLNGDRVDLLTYEEIMKRIQRLKPPHKCEFRRYDYRYDALTDQWISIAELRAQGVCIEDPLLARMAFITMAGQGDKHGVMNLLRQGIDPMTIDMTGNTALVSAAVHRQHRIMEMLVKAGTNVNAKDVNGMTALLYIMHRGDIDTVRLLLVSKCST
jgi:hypothetical protein